MENWKSKRNIDERSKTTNQRATNHERLEQRQLLSKEKCKRCEMNDWLTDRQADTDAHTYLHTYVCVCIFPQNDTQLKMIKEKKKTKKKRTKKYPVFNGRSKNWNCNNNTDTAIDTHTWTQTQETHTKTATFNEWYMKRWVFVVFYFFSSDLFVLLLYLCCCILYLISWKVYESKSLTTSQPYVRRTYNRLLSQTDEEQSLYQQKQKPFARSTLAAVKLKFRS